MKKARSTLHELTQKYLFDRVFICETLKRLVKGGDKSVQTKNN